MYSWLQFWERNLAWLATRIFGGFDDVLYVDAINALPFWYLLFSSKGSNISFTSLIKK